MSEVSEAGRRCRRQVGGVGATYDTAHTWSQGAEVSECRSERVSEGVGVSEKCRRSVRAECRSVGPGLNSYQAPKVGTNDTDIR